jgi:hypothetical protein
MSVSYIHSTMVGGLGRAITQNTALPWSRNQKPWVAEPITSDQLSNLGKSLRSEPVLPALQGYGGNEVS